MRRWERARRARAGARRSSAHHRQCKHRAYGRPEVGALRGRIRQHRRENRSALSDEEREHLAGLVDLLRAFDDVITVTGQLGNSADVTLEAFELANRGLRLEWDPVHEDRTGIEVVRVAVGAYHSDLIRRATGESYAVSHADRRPSMESEQGGISSSLCGPLTVRSSLLHTRDDGDLCDLELTRFRATDMGSWPASETVAEGREVT